MRKNLLSLLLGQEAAVASVKTKQKIQWYSIGDTFVEERGSLV